MITQPEAQSRYICNSLRWNAINNIHMDVFISKSVTIQRFHTLDSQRVDHVQPLVPLEP